MSAIYPLGRENLLDWAFNGGAPTAPADICMIGVTSGYTFSTAHETLADVSGANICIPEQVLSGVTITGGVIDANDLALTGLTPGPTLDAFIVYAKWAAASLLLFYIDSATDSSLPQVMTTSKINIGWPLAGIGRI